MAPFTGSGAFRNNSAYSTPHADFAQSLDPINSYEQGSSGGSYVARAGDTLQGIALGLWGDASLWYKLAEVNGLSAGSALIEGQSLALPVGARSSYHNASTFQPYDPASALGDLSPTNPKAPKRNKCGVMGAILLVVIAVAVTVVTSGAAIAALSPSIGGIGAGIGAFASGMAAGTAIGTGTMIAAGAIGGALGSIVSQGVGVATGIQQKFSWKGVGMSAIAGGISGGITSMGAAAQAGQLAGNLGKIGKFLTGGGFAGGAARGALSNALGQGIGVATGLQDKFDWTGVAAAGLGGGVSGHLGRDLQPLVGAGINPDNILGHMGVSGASAMANAAARTLLDGSDSATTSSRHCPT